MRVLFLVVLTGLLLSSCASKSPIARQLAGCDSLMITFNVPGTDSVQNMVTTTDTRAIAKLAGYLGGKEQPKPDCGFGGNMLFFKGGQQVLPVVFQSTKNAATSCLKWRINSGTPKWEEKPGNFLRA